MTEWSKSEDNSEAKKTLRKMNKIRNFPKDTCPWSRHAAMMAEDLIKSREYPMLLDEPVHCGHSIAVTVWALWKARTDLEKAKAALRDMLEQAELIEPKHPGHKHQRAAARSTLAEIEDKS